ncbi:response regulator [Marinihelvus fidelis]|uniref:Response regulator n=1 Tax=Marinihelvus fidelis TaxID=2613842 RepID=A0A5N0TGF3_9GAMM|nr:response regulator [Marinihelvus fidelis]KAA9133554.1 response regulator [Marinihelvus fidelis]
MDSEKTATRILVVEDNDTARDAIREFLDLSGYQVACAGSADEALSEAEKLHPDILVSDWQLKGQRDGVDVARELQDRFGVLVVFITGNALEPLRRSAADINVARYLRKPVSLPRLARLIGELPAA